MTNINQRVQHLNSDVMQALNAVQNKQKVTIDEVRDIRTAILKDGTIDEAEEDLIDELTEDNAKGIQIGGEGSATPSMPQSVIDRFLYVTSSAVVRAQPRRPPPAC